MMMTFLSKTWVGFAVGLIGFYVGYNTPQKPIDFKPSLSVSPTPVNVETKACPSPFDYEVMKRELQRVIDKNEARVLPRFGRK